LWVNLSIQTINCKNKVGTKIKTQKLIVIAAIVCLLAGAAHAQDPTGVWLLAFLNSASGDVSVGSDLCLVTFDELTEQGFDFRSATSTSLGKDGAQQAFAFTSDGPADAVFLTRVARWNLRELFGPGSPYHTGRSFLVR
jgi:hypothetical protein